MTAAPLLKSLIIVNAQIVGLVELLEAPDAFGLEMVNFWLKIDSSIIDDYRRVLSPMELGNIIPNAIKNTFPEEEDFVPTKMDIRTMSKWDFYLITLYLDGPLINPDGLCHTRAIRLGRELEDSLKHADLLAISK